MARKRAGIGLSQSLRQSNPMQDVFAFIGLGGFIGVSLYLVNEPLGTFLYKRRSQLQDGIAPLPDTNNNSSARAGPRTPPSTPPTPPPPPPPPPSPRDSIIHLGSLPAPSTSFPPLSTSLDAIPNNNNKLPAEVEALMIVEALIIPHAEEQIQRRELEQAEEQQRAEREYSRVREEEEKNEKKKKKKKKEEEEEKQEAQAKLELCQQEELAATMRIRKKDLALEQQLLAAEEAVAIENHVNVEEEKEKVAPPLKPLLTKRRVYSWASFNSTPALEMHRQKKETHYSSSSSNNNGEAAGSKVAPDDQNNKLLAIHRERKLTYYSEEADS